MGFRFPGVTVFEGVVAGLAFLLALWIHSGFALSVERWQESLVILPIIAIATMIGTIVYGTNKDFHRSYIEICVSIGMLVITVGIVSMAATFLLGIDEIPRGAFAITLPILWLLLCGWKAYVIRRYRREYFSQKAAILSETNEGAQRVFERGLAHILRGADHVYAHEFDENENTLESYTFVLAASDLSHELRHRLVGWAARSKREILLVPDSADVLLRSAQFTRIGDIPVLQVSRFSLSGAYQVFKRVTDICAATLLLIVFSPVFLLVPVLMKLLSPGPIFYSQERAGINGTAFNVYKFRTMVVDAEANTGPIWSSGGKDPRVTPIGRWLRATRLDELPQLWNVLKGEMSLIGPRPERPVFVEEFSRTNPDFRLRETIKPGLTGFAQVFGRYDTDPIDKLRYDLMYIAQYSPLLDIQILFWTVQAVLFPQSWVEKQADRMASLELQLMMGRSAVQEVATGSDLKSR